MHINMNVHKALAMKSHDGEQRGRSVHVYGHFLLIFSYLWARERQRERLTDSDVVQKYRSRKSAKLAVLATTPEEVLDCPLCSCRLERKAHPLPLPHSLPSTLSLCAQSEHMHLFLLSPQAWKHPVLWIRWIIMTLLIHVHSGYMEAEGCYTSAYTQLTLNDLFCIRDKGRGLCAF